jgi:hypothetical protein
MTHLLLRTLKLAAFGLSIGAATAGVAHASENRDPASHPTIRAMLGAKTVDHLDPKRTALIVIDFQNEYFTGRMPIPDGKRAMEHAKHRVCRCGQDSRLPDSARGTRRGRRLCEGRHERRVCPGDGTARP